MNVKATAAPTDASFRDAGPELLATMLQASRRDTLATFACYEAALAENRLAVPCREDLNPPLWELGHVGWFQAHWLARNPDWLLGQQANPAAPRLPAVRTDADALYNSSEVPHASRWQLPLPDAHTTRSELDAVLQQSLALLHTAAALAQAGAAGTRASGDRASGEGESGKRAPGARDQALYFHRLCLAHEDMHHEAAVYMARALGISLHATHVELPTLAAPRPALRLAAGPCTLGRAASADEAGFAFDNECGQQLHALAAYEIDCQVLRWRDYLPFVEAGGYQQTRWWPGQAAAWRAAPGNQAPRYLQRAGSQWQQWRQGQWQPLNLDQPACHLTAFEADAWCAWAGRRLPTEAEWEQAARAEPKNFRWGAVWEWTASTFGPYDGFVAHPYLDYSAPWFGSRRVLRGASVATQRRMHDLRYRNFFTPQRNDIFAGFRSCAA